MFSECTGLGIACQLTNVALQRYILDSCMSKKELVQLAVDRVGGSVHKKKKKAKVAQENDGPAGPAGPAAVVNDDSD